MDAIIIARHYRRVRTIRVLTAPMCGIFLCCHERGLSREFVRCIPTIQDLQRACQSLHQRPDDPGLALEEEIQKVGVVLDFWRRSEEGGLEYALLREPCFEHLQTMCEEEDEDSEVILSSDDTTQVGAIHSMLSRTYSTYR